MVKEVLVSGDLVEDYPEQLPYPGALVLGWVGGDPLHVVLVYNPADGICLVINASLLLISLACASHAGLLRSTRTARSHGARLNNSYRPDFQLIRKYRKFQLELC